ncbi:MAG: hypothetical protein GX754_06425 [Clostridiaceae bacterium]|nr:hypothetical protein [Clostridiaceae bacterium]
MNENGVNLKDRSLLIKMLGWIFSLAGIGIAFLASLEIYCFYLFSHGGRFHYEGFGFGSFMFANIASQVIGYYIIALALLVSGYGHLKIKKWAAKLTVSLLYSWLITGIPLIIIAFFILVATKEMSITAILIILTLSILSYAVFPPLLICFYKRRNIVYTFEKNDKTSCRIEKIPVSVLAVSWLLIFYIIVLHILILLNGIFPVFGTFFHGLKGIILLDITILCLFSLVWGLLRLQPWAWRGTVFALAMITASAVITLFNSSYSTILENMKFPPKELLLLENIPIQGYHLAVLAGVPLAATWVLTIKLKRYFFKST